MPQPTPTSVHTNQPLTSVLINWFGSNQMAVATRLFPLVAVPKQSDLYYVWDRGDINRIVADKRAPQTEAPAGGYRLSSASYYAHRYAIKKLIDDATRANADSPLDLDTQATQWCARQLALRLEKVFAASAFTTGVWSTSKVGGVDFTKWDAGGSTPVDDLLEFLDDADEMTGVKPNKICFGADAWRVFIRHADVIDLIKAGQTPGGPAIANESAVASILGVDEVMVARLIENTAAEGATDVSARILNAESVLAVYTPSAASLVQPSAGYTFAWEGLAGSTDGMRTRTYRDDPVESDVIECDGAWDPKVTAADLGVFLSDVLV
jgi:hypothetical protein